MRPTQAHLRRYRPPVGPRVPSSRRGKAPTQETRQELEATEKLRPAATVMGGRLGLRRRGVQREAQVVRPGTWAAFLGRLGAKENEVDGVQGKAILRKIIFSLFGVENQEGFIRYQKGAGGDEGACRCERVLGSRTGHLLGTPGRERRLRNTAAAAP